MPNHVLRGVAAAVPLFAATAVAGTFLDDFEDGLDPSVWMIDDSGGSGDFYVEDDAGGDLRFAYRAGNPDNADRRWTLAFIAVTDITTDGQPLQGDFELSVDFAQAVLPSTSGIDQVQLEPAFADGTTFLNVRDDFAPAGDNVHVWDDVDVRGVTSYAADNGRLSIRREGSTLYAAINGSDFYTLANATTSDLTFVGVRLQNNAGSDAATSVRFDNFQLSGATVIPSPAAAGGGVALLGLLGLRRRFGAR